MLQPRSHTTERPRALRARYLPWLRRIAARRLSFRCFVTVLACSNFMNPPTMPAQLPSLAVVAPPTKRWALLLPEHGSRQAAAQENAPARHHADDLQDPASCRHRWQATADCSCSLEAQVFQRCLAGLVGRMPHIEAASSVQLMLPEASSHCPPSLAWWAQEESRASAHCAKLKAWVPACSKDTQPPARMPLVAQLCAHMRSHVGASMAWAMAAAATAPC